MFKMTPLNVDKKIDLSMQQGELREAMGRMFVKRLEKLADELLSKIDCPCVFWIIYTVKWDDVNRKIKEMWQVVDEAPTIKLGQVIYEVHKSGKAHFMALPLDIPVPDSALSDNLILDNAEVAAAMPLSMEEFHKI